MKTRRIISAIALCAIAISVSIPVMALQPIPVVVRKPKPVPEPKPEPVKTPAEKIPDKIVIKDDTNDKPAVKPSYPVKKPIQQGPETYDVIPYSPADEKGWFDASQLDAVDLGLSVKWAQVNLGAANNDEAGVYFPWADPVARHTFNSTCSSSNKKLPNIAGDATYDAATAAWGDEWRLPTSDELRELYEKCTWEWCSYPCGYIVTSKQEGNTNAIFLPAPGYMGSGYDSVDENEEAGYYWSSTPGKTTNNAFILYFEYDNPESCTIKEQPRNRGFVIRPVKK